MSKYLEWCKRNNSNTKNSTNLTTLESDKVVRKKGRKSSKARRKGGRLNKTSPTNILSHIDILFTNVPLSSKLNKSEATVSQISVLTVIRAPIPMGYNTTIANGSPLNLYNFVKASLLVLWYHVDNQQGK